MPEGPASPASVHHNNFDPANPLLCIENNPSVPRNCTITRPPPITRYRTHHGIMGRRFPDGGLLRYRK